jgi:CHAT domain-containing protein
MTFSVITLTVEFTQLAAVCCSHARAKAESCRYRILHFATHVVFDPASPLLRSNPYPSGGGEDDGVWEAREILDAEFDADLAVLAASRTARGRVLSGEVIVGLSWAFFVAGCTATVVSQWKFGHSREPTLAEQGNEIEKRYEQFRDWSLQ